MKKKLPSSWEEANALAEAVEAPIEAARARVADAQQELKRICVEQYPVGSRVEVNVAARRSPVHEVVAVTEHGWLTLRNITTGTERGLTASSSLISPCRHWYVAVLESRTLSSRNNL